ncbi:MAG: hypothetical protein IJV43_10385, partial [Oscillospiraceae bacterium]|nr:hypothetical protein [Oscillospiraceae bacterium]
MTLGDLTGLSLVSVSEMCIWLCGETGFEAARRICDVPVPFGAVPAVPERIGGLTPLPRGSADGRSCRSCCAGTDVFSDFALFGDETGAFLLCRSSLSVRRVIWAAFVPAVPELLGGVLPLS